MAAELETVKGLIELQDNYTSELGLAQAALSNFTKENQESLKAVAGAAGLVAAAIGAIIATTIKLGERGSDVNDVKATLNEFAGSAKNADAVMRNLREGTKGTVDDFELARNAARLLSTGVKLTAEDFGTLSSAAFALQNRGLGPTKEQLDTISDALVTGRSKALAAKLGIVDLGDAQANYAKQLGISVDQLSDAGKAEAARIQVMQMLKTATKQAGDQQRDFGEEIEAAKVAVKNWVDDLASAVAVSPVFKAGMDTIKSALSEAFGGDSRESIKAVVNALEQTVIYSTYVANATIEAARVVHTAWSGVKVLVLGLETVFTTVFDVITSGVSEVANVAAKLHIISPETAQQVADLRDQFRGMSNDLAKQTAEAMKGVVGASDFDKTLDSLGGTVDRVRDAMVTAANATAQNTETDAEATAGAGKLAAAQGVVAQSMIDRQKVEDQLWKIQAKSLDETSQLWEEFFALRAEHEGSTVDAQKASINAWRNNEIEKLDASDKNWNEHYASINAVADEKLKGVGSMWDTVKDKSISALRAQYEAAVATYNQMVRSGDFFREDIDKQRSAIDKAADAMRGFGQEAKQAEEAAAAATKKTNDELAKQKKAADDAKAAMMALGSSFTYDLSTKEGIAQYRKMNPAAEIIWSDEQIMAYIKKGGALEGLIKSGVINPYAHMGSTGFVKGGSVDIKVGEEGPEVVRVPLGSTVYPNNMTPPGGGGGDSYQVIVNVNGTPEDAAKRAAKIIMDGVKMRKRFGASQ